MFPGEGSLIAGKSMIFHKKEIEKIELVARPGSQQHSDLINLAMSSRSLYQFWPLTQFFSVSFLWKLIDLPGGQINDPSSGKHYSLPFLPATPSSLSQTLLPELQRYKDTVRCAALSTEVPGHRQKQLTQTLIVRLLKTHFFTLILDFEKSIE